MLLLLFLQDLTDFKDSPQGVRLKVHISGGEWSAVAFPVHPVPRLAIAHPVANLRIDICIPLCANFGPLDGELATHPHIHSQGNVIMPAFVDRNNAYIARACRVPQKAANHSG